MRTIETPVTLLLAESGHAVGGTERVVWELATRLPPRRFRVNVWLSPDAGVDELARWLEGRNVAVERVPEVESRWDWRGMLDTWRRLKRLRPELMHVHHVRPAADRYLTTLGGFAGVSSVVVSEHHVEHGHSNRQRVLKRHELGQAGAVTAVCGSVADALVAEYGVDRARVRIVGNGADLPDEKAEAAPAREIRQALGANANRPLLVCAARLEEQKGHRVLLRALATLKTRGLDFVVALAGEGSLRPVLETEVQSLGLSRDVVFTGQVEAFGPLLAAADAVVMPSLWEAMPLTLLEAMARGRVVVASAVGGIPEVVEDGVSGLLVPPGDADALADVLERVRGFPHHAAALGEAAARRVRTDLTWERVVERFESVYDEVLGLASFEPEPPGRVGGGA